MSISTVEPEKTGRLSFILENDLFYNVDNHYTTGVGFIWVPDRRTPTPAWAVKLAHLVPWVSEQSTFRHGYVVGPENSYNQLITNDKPGKT